MDHDEQLLNRELTKARPNIHQRRQCNLGRIFNSSNMAGHSPGVSMVTPSTAVASGFAQFSRLAKFLQPKK
jgi:hypothetical protein